MIYKKLLPSINFVLATSALSFQVFVLYPWHHQLSNEFNVLNKEINQLKQLLDKK
jgi:hypothetical protein